MLGRQRPCAWSCTGPRPRGLAGPLSPWFGLQASSAVTGPISARACAVCVELAEAPEGMSSVTELAVRPEGAKRRCRQEPASA